MKIIFIDTTHPVLLEMLIKKGFDCEVKNNLSKQEIQLILPNYDGVVVRSRFKIDKEFIDCGRSLKFIARPGAGLENIDVEYAESKGIKCLRSPEGNRDSVAEHCIAMLLSLFNKINWADQEIRNGIWKRNENWGLELKNKTIAIIGYGYMGRAFAKRLSGFEVNVLVYDKYLKNYLPNLSYCKESTMSEIFENADILSIHLPLSEETNQLVNLSYLKKFKKDIFIINTARGGIVNLSDLCEAIEIGKVKGACLDVFDFEESTFEKINFSNSDSMEYLTKSKKVILTPHIAGWTFESNEKIASILGEKIIRHFSL